jgi:hypothetical protein
VFESLTCGVVVVLAGSHEVVLKILQSKRVDTGFFPKL